MNGSSKNRCLKHLWICGVLICVWGVWGAAGCAGDRGAYQPASSSPAAVPPADRISSVEQTLRDAADQWQGTPHRMGGLDTRGVDCSGLVMRLYQDLFGMRLPRTTALQVRKGRPVARGRWQAGDLLFFKPPWKTRHVGIYLGGNEFLHASASAGVTISRVDSAYWRKAYWTSRRVLMDG